MTDAELLRQVARGNTWTGRKLRAAAAIAQARFKETMRARPRWPEFHTFYRPTEPTGEPWTTTPTENP
jgi:hypothetical protein